MVKAVDPLVPRTAAWGRNGGRDISQSYASLCGLAAGKARRAHADGDAIACFAMVYATASMRVYGSAMGLTDGEHDENLPAKTRFRPGFGTRLRTSNRRRPTIEEATWSVVADVGLDAFLRADVNDQLAVKPASDRPTDYARPLLMLMKSEHDVPFGRNARLGVGIEFVELHWEEVERCLRRTIKG